MSNLKEIRTNNEIVQTILPNTNSVSGGSHMTDTAVINPIINTAHRTSDINEDHYEGDDIEDDDGDDNSIEKISILSHSTLDTRKNPDHTNTIPEFDTNTMRRNTVRVNEKLYTENKCPKNIIYLDNNATTLMCPLAIKALNVWSRCYNPASSSKYAKNGKMMIEQVKKYISTMNNFNLDKYAVIFTSGGTESNCMILRSIVTAYNIKKGIPHILSSKIEHHSILECLSSLEQSGEAQVTLVDPDVYGQIRTKSVKRAIRPNTALISIMYANNETGAINNIPKIGAIAHRYRIPLHTDCVQIYGKYKIDIPKSNIDALSASFHKLYGPKGSGLLIISNDLISGYELKGEINGSQQYGLRGGTENPSAVASIGAAMVWNFKNRDKKNAHHKSLVSYIMREFSKHFPILYYDEFMEKHGFKEPTCTRLTLDENTQTKCTKLHPIEIVLLGPHKSSNTRLNSTLLISIAKHTKPDFCNVKFKKKLDNLGIVVSIASACLTSSDKASHVLTSMRAPPIIKRGVLRISVSDYTTIAEIQKFTKIIIAEIKKYHTTKKKN